MVVLGAGSFNIFSLSSLRETRLCSAAILIILIPGLGTQLQVGQNLTR